MLKGDTLVRAVKDATDVSCESATIEKRRFY